jgi:N-carbamoyl-L-amino-acid hydrolase
MTITIDKIGNGFMRRAGRNNSLPPIDDRQPHRHPAHRRQVRRQLRRAGGLEVVRTLNDHGVKTEAPIEVAFWTNEEGSRFVPVMMGSGVFAGPSRWSMPMPPPTPRARR